MKITKKLLKKLILEAMEEELALGPVMAALGAEEGLDPDFKNELEAVVKQMPPQAVEDIEALMSVRIDDDGRKVDAHQIVELVDYAYGGDYVDFEYILHNLGLPDELFKNPVGKRIEQMVLARQEEVGEKKLASYDDELNY